jgi:hypothetical protein
MNTNPSKQEADYIRDALTAFNDEKVGQDGHTPLNIIEYDKDGNRTRMNEYVSGELVRYRTYTYDENGVANQEIHDAADEK